MKKKLYMVLLIIVIIMLGIVLFLLNKEKNISDSEKFSKEYNSVTKNNVFVYKEEKQIVDILEKGTGIVYLGFPECPWCNCYVKYLNEVSMDKGIKKIFYKNILEDRKNNTKFYKKLVSILSDYLQYDEEGDKRIYVPAVIFVKSGKIVGFDDETAWDTKGYKTPEEYWNNEDLEGLKNRLSEMIDKISLNVCTSDCNK